MDSKPLPQKPPQKPRLATKAWKKDHAAVLRLTPRAWKPTAVNINVDSESRLFWVHPDGKVYEQKAGHKYGGHGTVRRVKDRNLIARVHQAFGAQLEQRRGMQDRAAGIVDRVLGGGKA